MQCFVASIISQASFPRPCACEGGYCAAVELQHDGADLRLFQLVARKQPYLLSLSVQSG